MGEPHSVLVIPAYNEAATIRELVERCLSLALPTIVIDDGSSDGTATALDGLPITRLRHEQNRGKAAALWWGMQQALQLGATQIITIDGDGQHRPEDIPALLQQAEKHPGKIIIAARRKNRERATTSRRAANHFADFWISWAAGEWIHDTQSGFRLYPSELISQLQPKVSKEQGFVFESRTLIEGAQLGVHCTTIPIAYSHHAARRASHFRPVVDISRIVLMVAWSLMSRGFYPAGLWRALKSRSSPAP